jgi:hypothetical protein
MLSTIIPADARMKIHVPDSTRPGKRKKMLPSTNAELPMSPIHRWNQG